jgi:hypothetical protein
VGATATEASLLEVSTTRSWGFLGLSTGRLAGLPERVDWSRYLGEVYDQGVEETCAELARAGVIDFLDAAGLEPAPEELPEVQGILEALSARRPVEVDHLQTPDIGHRFLAYGYDLDSGLLLVRSTWGAEWGEDGNGYLAFDAALLGAVAW